MSKQIPVENSWTVRPQDVCMVGVVSYKMFALVVTCKKEHGRETIDQWDMDISRDADAVV